MLGIEQKKGNDDNLCGRMIAYAKILPSPDAEAPATPFDDMVKNGLLALEGDFRKAQTPEASHRKLSKAVDEKFNNLLATMEENGIDIPENMNVEAMRERIHELSNMEVIPIPARIGNFESEEDILNENADIYFIGEYIGVNQAHFCLTTLPIYYQARYREQTKRRERDLLYEMLSQIEGNEFVDTAALQENSETLFPDSVTLNTFVGDLNTLLNTRVIPFLLACKDENEYEKQIGLFYNFMKDYPVQNDVKRIDFAIRALREQSDSTFARQILELGCQKINALYNEDVKLAEELETQISKSKP